ncbi:MAG: metal-sulfur cluster assembly factor, partial [Acidobacteria bacterium]|nr:metal-sulfur cluster assembly factor [Acidobacteriota bacterium]
MSITIEQVRQALQPVQDPEIGFSIVDLGLIRGIEVDDATGVVTVKMTMTSPMCPLAPEMIEAAR